jgi:hypothetical protein
VTTHDLRLPLKILSLSLSLLSLRSESIGLTSKTVVGRDGLAGGVGMHQHGAMSHLHAEIVVSMSHDAGIANYVGTMLVSARAFRLACN